MTFVEAQNDPDECSRCQGSGEVHVRVYEDEWESRQCPTCAGDGLSWSARGRLMGAPVEPLADENQCGYPIGPRPADGLNTDNRFTVLLCVLPSGHLGDHLPAERWR